MRLVDDIFKRLALETSTVYMVAGGGAMHLVDALGLSSLNYVAAIHEQGAGYMAIGHAMATNSLGVVLVTSGPGSTNALSACSAAWMDSVPVLFISGQAKTSSLVGGSGLRTRGVQEIGIIEMVDSVTKIAEEPKDVKKTLEILEKMLVTCKSERPGPCWLSVPLDVQGMEV